MKITAIFSGDQYDLSVEHLIIPDNVSIKEEKEKWDKWYKEVYSKNIGTEEYITLSQWLIKLGARKPNDDELIEFWED